ncbi:YheC/YheD family protein [Paenibacillus sp.]|uniref:YheC/YheD family endospore coat-associated protein n=1 Tax=Paenibacillus sp. TaxID=58172 RepID=UPI0028121867|nr:YheC/YheD family protein [Paenibacillus sp.]
MIGMLYPRALISRLMKGGRSFEKPAFYVQAAREAGEEIWFFSLVDIDWNEGTARGWNGIDPVWKRRPIPDVILNRTRTTRASARRSILRLKRMGKLVCNERNVVSKLTIHRILVKEPALQPYLPETASLSTRAVNDLLAANRNVFLKPSRASVGNGIIRISRADGATYAEVNRLGRTERKRIDVRRIAALVKGKRRNYLVQQGIPLMKYRGRPVDFRVSIQRGADGNWQCTGMVGKVARKRAIVTNLHCGGTSMKAGELFREWGWNHAEVEARVAELGVRIATALERELPPIADLGLDIALDDQGHPWFIESNFRDLRITFRNAGDRQTWADTFHNPVRYAAALLRSRERGSAR